MIELPDDDQEVILCAAERSDLWSVVSGLGSLHSSDTDPQLRERAVNLVRKYLADGWIQLERDRYRARRVQGDSELVPDHEALDLLDRREAWDLGPPPDGEQLVISLTERGRSAVEGGAIDRAYPRFLDR